MVIIKSHEEQVWLANCSEASSEFWETRTEMLVYMVASRKWAACSTWKEWKEA